MTHIDKHHLRAAEGWLELGDHVTAFEELENIDPLNRANPDVLSLRWDIYTHAKAHVSAEGVARGLTRMLPKKFEPWWQLSYSLHEMGRTQEAYDSLVSVQDRFPGEWLLHYNLACYLTRLGRLDKARPSLKLALSLNPKQRTAALEDPDLEPLWNEEQRSK